MSDQVGDNVITRRGLVRGVGILAAIAGLGGPAALGAAEPRPVPAGRPLVRFPEKTELLLLTRQPPQLETPMSYFDRAITPNEAFFVRYHTMPYPTRIDPGRWRLTVTGHVERALSLSLADLTSQFPKVTLTAVAQCAGNSRSRFEPRVLGGQWGDGAMGCAVWTGVRLRDLLAAAGIRPGAVDVTFNGADRPAFKALPDFVKALRADRIMSDPDVMVAYAMNGRRLPMLNGFPARLVVPGWYATYWVKHLTEITVLAGTFEDFWMKPAYRIPDTACGCVEPGTAPQSTVPINRMKVRSFIASPADGSPVTVGRPVMLKGVAFDDGHGIRQVMISDNAGQTWWPTTLGPDLGRYAFREWSAAWTPRSGGPARLMVRAITESGDSQGLQPLWNPSGYMRNVVEQITLVGA